MAKITITMVGGTVVEIDDPEIVDSPVEYGVILNEIGKTVPGGTYLWDVDDTHHLFHEEYITHVKIERGRNPAASDDLGASWDFSGDVHSTDNGMGKD